MAKASSASKKTAAKSSTRTARTEETALPSRETARAAFTPALDPRHDRVREALGRLAADAPQVLIMEGGLAPERYAMALWYTARLNCAEPDAPCLACPACLQVGAELFEDLFVLDGREGRIKIQAVRDLRVVLGEAPRGTGKRVIIMAEAQSLGVEAANALLKSLEEPRPGLCFLLLAPQREQLLPTLVSRGWAVTLAWPEAQTRTEPAASATTPDLAGWEHDLAAFIRSGQGWFNRTAAKGAATPALARELVLAVQRALVADLVNEAGGPLKTCLRGFPPAAQLHVCDVLRQTEESLAYTVNPALVLDWMATRLHMAHRRVRRG